MIMLTENSLDKRHQEFNAKVNEAVAKNVRIEDIQSETNKTDINIFFKIDLASKYKNIDYIIEILKSGDSLHITRALKSIWLYDDEYFNIINPDYLNTNIFPMMSLKMKRKFLTSISTHVQNEERASTFYTYCMAQKLPNIAHKFLLNTSESMKLRYLEENKDGVNSMLRHNNDKYFIHFIGNSFILANAYLEVVYELLRNHALYGIRHLYSVSDIKYLEFLEKYGQTESSYYKKKILGLRISQNIMEKHKNRVLELPRIYLEMLNKNMIVRNSNSSNAKLYLVSLLPEKCSSFWNERFCEKNKFLLDLIPTDEKFQFMKKIFTDSYPGQEFEMTDNFFRYEYYNLMTIEEREAWAIKQIESQKEILGDGKDYIWYKFVNFARAFEDVKNIVMITPGKDKRGDIINILIESAKNQSDLEKLFNHYYQRHVNEDMHNKKRFLNKVTEYHNVFDFDDNCWTAYNKLLHSIDVYSESMASYCAEDFTLLALLYHILHRKEVPSTLKRYLKTESYYYTMKTYLQMLDEERKETVYQYILEFYIDLFKNFENKTYNEEIMKKARLYTMLVVKLMKQFGKTKKDCPEIVEKYVNLDWEHFRKNMFFNEDFVTRRVTQDHFLRHLKKDSALVINDLPLVKERIECEFQFNLNKLLRKLKIYFPNDVAKIYLDFFTNLLSDTKPYISYSKIKSSVHGIFQLADDNFKSNFMMKHVPTDAKIDHSNKDEQLLYTQEYICRFACYSRPPVPLTDMLMYIKGDYVHYCLPMFNMYLANLPLPQCLKFVEAILNAPLSIQKHGIRMAFRCFNTENLKTLILNIWKKTKNVSLRLIIYRALYNKIVKENETAQKQLFETLKVFTLDLHQDDDDEIFNLLTSNNLPSYLICDLVEAGWKAVSKFPNKAKNLERMTRIIKVMCNHIKIMEKAAIKPIIDDHIKIMLIDEQIRPSYDKNELNELYKQKWMLVVHFIMNVNNEDDLEEKIVLLRSITNKCFEMWDVVHLHMYIMRTFYTTFISYIKSRSLCHDITGDNNYSNKIFKVLLEDLEQSLPILVSYLHVWDLRLNIITRDVSIIGKRRLVDVISPENELLVIKEIILNFGREVGNIIKEFLEMNLYFKSLLSSIQRGVQEELGHLYYFIFNLQKYKLNLNDIYVITAIGLLEFDIPETYLLALNLLPLNYDRGFYEDYINAIKKIKAFENPEIHCNMYEKFVNTDFVHRDFMDSKINKDSRPIE